MGTENKTESTLILHFNKPYIFEGESYSELDLTGLENIKGRDIIAICRKFGRSGTISVAPQLEVPFTMEIATRATGLPIEFFENMSPAKVFAVHSLIVGFLTKED